MTLPLLFPGRIITDNKAARGICPGGFVPLYHRIQQATASRKKRAQPGTCLS